MSVHTVSTEINGLEYSFETGKLARFSNGSIMVKHGDTMVLVTVVAGASEIDADFMPLQVEYREKSASAGKFPGGFLKREGRPSDNEVLTSRLIDRPCRPLFPDNWRYETQILATVFSYDKHCSPDTLAGVGASAALMISDIPFAGPISQVRVGRIDGEFVCNPSVDLLEESDMDMTVAGSDTSIVMVEGESKEISEEDFLAAMDFAHKYIRQLNDLQRELVAKIAPEKREVTVVEIPEEISNFVNDLAVAPITEFIHKDTTKKERTILRREIKEMIKEKVEEEFAEKEGFEDVNYMGFAMEALGKVEKKLMREMILQESRRLDGRETTKIRNIDCEVGILPRSHGSGLFTRGETQSLTTTTLGTKSDEQMIDGLLPTYTEKFILHYNFPPFSTGEVKRLGTSRREIGHGHLAWRALKGQLPEYESFPYSIRIVSEILESNGSSSMATVCAGTLSMYDAGIPMKKPVAGIAMGLIKEEEDVAILSDILGDEDHLGDMDFKVCGTEDGITAFQMDIKIEGLSIEIMKNALEQARQGRMHILGEMLKAIEEPRDDLSAYAPRFETIFVPKDMIGAIIGPGGENIRNLTRETETDINIEDDGKILIAAVNKESAMEARRRIELMTEKPEVGKVYEAKIKEVRPDLGAICEFMPGKTGLLHISQIAHERIEDATKVLNEGETVEVKLTDATPDGKYRLSRKALLHNPNPRPPREDRGDRRGGDRRNNDRRGGGRGDRRPHNDRRVPPPPREDR